MGIYGNFFHYAMVIAMVGSAFLIFLYLWKKNRLDMDEDPKFQMLSEEDHRRDFQEDHQGDKRS